jgi:TatD DNase family protein
VRKCAIAHMRQYVKTMTNPYQLIDTHAHLDDIVDLEEAIEAAKKAGITAIIAVGVDMASNQKVLQIAAQYLGFVYPALGYYPGNIKEAEIDANLEFMKANIAHAVAIGEVGLDYSKWVRAGAAKETQQRVLQEIFKIAKDYDKPALIHSRYAWRDALALAVEAGLEKAVFHWYTGPLSVLRDIIARGYYISATPAVEYHAEHQQAIKETPLEQLLLETDCPVVYAKGREGEFTSTPADVVRSLKGAAALKGVSESDIAATTTRNAQKLFRLSRMP